MSCYGMFVSVIYRDLETTILNKAVIHNHAFYMCLPQNITMVCRIITISLLYCICECEMVVQGSLCPIDQLKIVADSCFG